VGNHGRDSPFLTMLLVFALVAAVRVQVTSPYQDLAPDLAARIASAIPAGTTLVSIVAAPDTESDDITPILADVSSRLVARGLTVSAPNEGAPAIRLSCLRNLRERTCAAEIRMGTARDVMMVSRADNSTSRAGSGGSPSIVRRLLFSQRALILDVALVADRLLVLDVNVLSIYQRTAEIWQRVDSLPLPTRTWPRDPRGTLRVENGSVEVWVPGFRCTVSMGPTLMSCGDLQRAWPLGIDNRGLEAGRNFFTTPEGQSFYSVATLADTAGARWIIAGPDGALTWLDAGRRSAGNAGSGDDVAGLSAACGTDSLLVTIDHVPGRSGDVLTLFQAVRRRLVPIGPPVTLAGTATALWSSPGAEAATLIVHDADAARYEAFQISIDCGR
jgi:hypothetical protein